MLKRWSRSLRARLVLASIVVEILMLGLLVANSNRINRAALIEQDVRWVETIGPLLNASLAELMVKNDYDAINSVLKEIRTDRALSYFVLEDHNGNIVAAEGWNPGQAPPVPDSSIRVTDPDQRFDHSMRIEFAGQSYGTLRYGLNIESLNQAQKKLISESLIIGAAMVVLTTLLLLGVGYFLTRHLSKLTEAGRAMAQGKLSTQVDIKAKDEVGELAHVFNSMVRSIADRISQIKDSEAKFHAIADYSYDCEMWLSPQGALRWINPRVTVMTLYTIDECHAMSEFPLDLIAEADRERMRAERARAIGGETGSDIVFKMLRKDGTEFWAAAHWNPIYDDRGVFSGTRISIHDVSQTKYAEEKLSATLQELERAYAIQREYLTLASGERARLNALLSAMQLGILFVDADHKVIYSNPAFEQIWLLSDSKLRFVGMDARSVLGNAHRMLESSEHSIETLMQPPDAEQGLQVTEVAMADGRKIHQSCHPVRNSEEQLIGYLWIYQDVTREQQTAEQLLFLAERDALTGLYNRHRFQEELSRTLADSARHNHRVALLFFDIDEFKYINDTFGHRAGDAMLVRVAGEVSAQVRRNELLARLGGDEFAILAPDLTEEEAQGFAERLVRALSQISFSFEGQNLRLTCSLGIAFYPLHAATADDLVACADVAMYQAKEAGKNTFRIYREDESATQAMKLRLDWNERIQRALENDLYRLHFQGVFDCATGALRHLEALVRMIDANRPNELIMPHAFIPIAEKNGKILEIDRWVIREAIRTLHSGAHVPPIAVNISGRSFNDPTLPRYIADELKRAGVAPSRLIVELTETSAVADLHDAQRFIGALRAEGCSVCLDDFGAGFSSFGYLKHIEADILKIDGQFIRNLPDDRANQVFVKAIVDVARGLHKTSVAESVEDGRTFAMLQSFGIGCAQGYFLEYPVESHTALVA